MESVIMSIVNPFNYFAGTSYGFLVLLGLIFFLLSMILWFILFVVCIPFVIIAVLVVGVLWDFQLYAFIFWIFYSPFVMILLGFLSDVCDTYKRNRSYG